ncbi:MAG TPA: glycoside hydrolase family 57 protein [Candidatus Acidoferrales bacterium]|nr:glycoside hydrolase family 57 protein [Candidatus Acidoferrales bacterium]
MSRVHLTILWHMHQPQYKDPVTGEYRLPWTRLHALKDYWGMVKMMEEFPKVHATFNVVPLLAEQIEEYASGLFKEPWFEIAFADAGSLTFEQRKAALERGFQVNDLFLQRWPRFGELRSRLHSSGVEASAAHWSAGDWRDLQMLSQLAWMDEEYLQKDPAVRGLSDKGSGFTEDDKAILLDKQHELLAAVLPEYRLAAARRQIEVSTTPYYHPILPLLCDSDIASVANPHTPRPVPAFRYAEDAREQLVRAVAYHERVFGQKPAGLWPSEGSVSDQALEIAMDLGFKWFATDEGVLGRTKNIGFWRDASGYPENGAELYTPWRLRRNGRQMTGFFRDHYISDLAGFVYSRMGAHAAAEDLHRRIRSIGDREPKGHTATVSVILDGENAWEYYPENGREFLREFYRRIEKDPNIFAYTMSEAMEAAPDQPVLEGIFPASWINANFDVWIGHGEDVRAWDLLRDARDAYQRAAERAGLKGNPASAAAVAREAAPHDGKGTVAMETSAQRDASTADSAVVAQLARAFESVLAAEGSDWCWWYGPEHGSQNDADFDALYRKHLSEIYRALGEPAPDALARPIKKAPERGQNIPPQAFLDVQISGRESSYFEWLGAGIYTTSRQGGAMHGRLYVLAEFLYGFSNDRLFLRVDPFSEAVESMREFQLRVTIWGSQETRITLRVENRKLTGVIVERAGICLLDTKQFVEAAYDKIMEVSVARAMFDLSSRRELLLSVALWSGGLPVDVLPVEGMLAITLGEENFAWG